MVEVLEDVIWKVITKDTRDEGETSRLSFRDTGEAGARRRLSSCDITLTMAPGLSVLDPDWRAVFPQTGWTQQRGTERGEQLGGGVEMAAGSDRPSTGNRRRSNTGFHV